MNLNHPTNMKTNSTITTFMARTAMMLLLIVMTASTWAQDNLSEVEFSGFTATDGTGDSENEGFACLVDGRYTEDEFTKWYFSGDKHTFKDEDKGCWFVDFHSDSPITIFKYILTSADDVDKYPERNPKSWKIKAKLQMKDDWVTIAAVSDDQTMGNSNYTDYEFDLNTPGTYQYFRFEVFESQRNNDIQLGELRFKKDITHIANATIEGLLLYYTYTGSAIDISYTVTDADGNLLEKGTHYTAAITNSSGTTVSEVKDKGSYKLTLTAVNGGGYTGVKEVVFDVVPWVGQGGFCGNPEKNNGKNLYYELTECEGGKMLTVYVNPDALGNDFTMKDYYESKHPWEEDKDDILQVVISNGVTSIGNNAFCYCTSLTSVTIPNSVTAIGKKAFFNCEKLETVIIPNNVTSIGQDAFERTPWLNNQDGVVYINNVAYRYRGEMPEGTTITLNEGTIAVGEGAFKDCENLKEVIIPNSVTSIGESAFNGCSGLKSLTIPNSVTSIGESAFENCSGLKSLTIPNSVTSIGDNTFRDCSGLTTVTIPNSVTSIGNDAFSGCSGLTSLTIPNSVSSIGNYAFQYCSGLTSMTIPNSVTSIGDYVFSGCSSLTTLTIPNSVTSIGNSAFYNCSNLTSMTIGNSVKSIGSSAFENCSNLTSVTIGNSVKSIGNSAFENCSSLTSVTIPNSVTSIGNYAFQNCSGLTSVTIPNSVTSIGMCVFLNCSGLTSVTIGSGVASIGMDVFYNCRNISDVYCYADPSDLTWGRCGKYDFKEDKGTRFHVFDEGAWSSKFGTYNVTFVGDLTIRLEDKADNTDLIASFNNQNRSVTLLDRTIYKDGSWTTLCLPFNLSSLTGTPLEGFTVKELDIETPYEGHKTGLSEGTLYLNFKDADGIVAGKPYIVRKMDVEPDLIIKSEDDWNTFAQNVSKGTSYEGKVVGLGNDISVSTMVDGNFRGTFDGNGHTISVNLNGGGDGLALFYTIDGATIQNVKAKGTVTSSNRRPATFTSFVEGNSTINNCWSSVDIVSTKTSDWVDGGAFVARVSTGATLNMTDCLFTGSITYNGGTTGGGMVGFTQTNATANLTNCLFSPSALTLTVNAYSPCVFVSGDQRGNLKNCYYNAVAKASALENEGIDGSSMASAELASALGTNWVVSGNNVIPDNIPGIKNPVFGGVIISSAEPATVTSDDGAVSFVAHYSPTELKSYDASQLYLGAASTLRYPAAATTIGSSHPWFQLNKGLTLSEMGDVNGDKAITVTDVMALVGCILEHANANFIQEHADTNYDNRISVTDVMKLVNMVLAGSKITSNVVINTNDETPISYDGN